ncbi:transposon Tf2-6 polyprotein [Trichonephila clavipes]|nr:transposon Tf2-6 polyprotein [Trichonephila clavipes]
MKYDIATINFVKENQNKSKPQYNCKKCGRKHKPRECPALGKICAKCQKKNHFAAKCFHNTKNIHKMNVPDNELVYIDSVNENETKCAMENITDSNFKNVEMEVKQLVNVKSKPILGLRGCKELKLIERIDAIECSISKNELIKQNKDVFTGVGEFPNEPYHIPLKDNAVPVIHPHPRDLNELIKKEHCQIPSTDDTISRLEGKKIFSVADLKDGFWNVPLDEVSSEICTFNTPFGRYKFNKMPFGCDEDSHDAIMSRVLERAKLLNIKFNPDKLQYRVSEVKYADQIVSKSGIKSDPDDIKAIVEMPTPKSKTEGREVVVQSDHKPLIAIVKKPKYKISSRMKRMILKLLQHNFEINYVPGNKMFLADTLSRAFPVNETVRDDPEMLNIVYTISKHLPMSEKN